MLVVPQKCLPPTLKVPNKYLNMQKYSSDNSLSSLTSY